MSSSNVGLVMRAWFRWKSLRLPWRKRFLVGMFSLSSILPVAIISYIHILQPYLLPHILSPLRPALRGSNPPILINAYIPSRENDVTQPLLTTTTPPSQTGSDLSGNTYWVFRLTGNTPPPSPSDTPAYQSSADDTRWRRIVKYPRSTHYSDVQVPPQWHQWLRYQRHDPPSLQEQQENVLRRQRMKVLAAEADARWAAKPSFLDQPAGQPAPNAAAATQAQDALTSSSANAADATTTQGEEVKEPTKGEEEKTKKKTLEEKEDPWKKATASGPSEEWQPAAWSPNNARKR
ncbi:hypothetical protein PGQ11_003131 [Apiospora arundinis]|uniref:NADH dehydrogenase [ubiquinone] 1 alpha subcomplex subunit n=1 Tax=Apiospora arundinis TaxID=335852 RepID=A0ABR2J5A5_9PEZI